jgi:hypothetical protein
MLVNAPDGSWKDALSRAKRAWQRFVKFRQRRADTQKKAEIKEENALRAFLTSLHFH